MQRFRLRGSVNVAAEFTLTAVALNLTRMWRVVPTLRTA